MLESMAVGLPVIATPVGGIPEAIDEGVNGFLISPGDVDALVDRRRRIIDDEDLRKSMGSSAKRIAKEKFSVECLVAQLEEIYLECERRVK
jgi:glycosyltransferase involved in cell wall biosynthesis